MKILDLYLGRNFLKFFIVIIVIPGVLFSFFELLSELDAVGKGSYTMGKALLFIVLTSPGRFLDLVPITALLAGIVALGRMADHFELVAMEAAGLSIPRISFSVLGASAVIMSTAVLCGEFVVPPMEQNARVMRAQAISVRGVTFTQKGFWARRGASFVHVSRLIGKDAAEDIDIFSFNEKGDLESFVHAGNAVITGKDHWVLYNVTMKTVKGMAVEAGTVDHLDLDSFLSQDQVSALELPPETLSTSELMDYIQALEKSGQNADHYRLALWRKLSQPLSTGAMVMLALSFVFGSIRKKSAGLRITIGSLVGIALYFFDQITMHAGLLLGLNPAVVAFIPFGVISGAAFLRLRQVV